MAEIGSVGAGMALESDRGVTVSVDEVGSVFSAGVIGAVSAGGTTGSEAAGAGSTAGAGAGSAAGADVGANWAGAALASGTPRSVFGFSVMCAAFFASGAGLGSAAWACGIASTAASMTANPHDAPLMLVGDMVHSLDRSLMRVSNLR